MSYHSVGFFFSKWKLLFGHVFLPSLRSVERHSPKAAGSQVIVSSGWGFELL